MSIIAVASATCERVWGNHTATVLQSRRLLLLNSLLAGGPCRSWGTCFTVHPCSAATQTVLQVSCWWLSFYVLVTNGVMGGGKTRLCVRLMGNTALEKTAMHLLFVMDIHTINPNIVWIWSWKFLKNIYSISSTRWFPVCNNKHSPYLLPAIIFMIWRKKKSPSYLLLR